MKIISYLILLLYVNQVVYAENSVESNDTIPVLNFKNNEFQFYNQASLDEKWEVLMQANVCYPGLPSGDALGELISKTIYSRLIKNILNYSTADIVPFLIEKVKSDRKTDIHFCNAFNGSEGDIALCYLQIVRGKRWHDFDGENAELKDMIQKHQSMTPETFDPIYKESFCIGAIAAKETLRDDLIEFLIKNIDIDTINHGQDAQTIWERKLSKLKVNKQKLAPR